MLYALQIREKTQYPSPWKQRTRASPDGEVTQIMSKTEPDGLRITKTKVTRDIRSPRNISSPGEHMGRGYLCNVREFSNSTLCLYVDIDWIVLRANKHVFH